MNLSEDRTCGKPLGEEETAMDRKTRNLLVVATGLVLAVAVCFAPTVSAAGRGNKWISLRYKFKPGQKLEYATVVMMASLTNTTATGVQAGMPMNMTMKTNLRMNTLQVDPRGTGTVKMSFDEFNIDAQALGESVNMRIGASGIKVYSGGQLVFDSSQTGGQQMPLGEILGLGATQGGPQLMDLFSKGITLTITKAGETTMPELGPGAAGGLMDINLFDQLPLPVRLVRPGDVWSSAPSIPGLGDKTELPGITLENRFAGIEDFKGRSCAKIVTKADIDLGKSPITQAQMPPGASFSKLRMVGDGTAYLDLEQGILLKQDGEFSIEMVGGGLMALPTPQGTGAVPPTMDMRSSITIKVDMELRK